MSDQPAASPNEFGDVRCPRDGEYVNVRCWHCGWLRSADEPPRGPTMTTDPNTPDAAEPVDIPALFRQLRAMQYRTDAAAVIDQLEAAVMPLPDRVEQPGDVLLVGRLRGGPALPAPTLAVLTRSFTDVHTVWMLPDQQPEGRRWYAREDLDDVRPARVVSVDVLEDIATLAHGIEHAEFDRPSPAETVAHHRIVARRILDAVNGLTRGA